MADNAWLTTAGEAKIVNSLASTTPFNITKWKIGNTPNIAFDQSLTDVVGTVVDNGTVSEMEFDVISDDSILLRVILDEAKGPYDVGNVGLFSDDDTLIAIGTFENARSKTPNAVGVVGNRLVISLPINFVDVQSAINFTVYTNVFSSWPFVQTIADLPDPSLSPFEGYIVREDPSQNRPITAIRNEEPAGSGTFVWTFDYHNIIAGDSASNFNKIEIDIGTGEQRFFINNNQWLTLKTSGRLGLETADPQANFQVGDFSGDRSILIGTGTNNAGRLIFNDATGTQHTGGLRYSHGDNSLTFITNDADVGKFTTSGDFRINNGNILRPDEAGVAFQVGNGINTSFGRTDFKDTTGFSTRVSILDSGPARFSDGDSTNPGISFLNNTNTGFWHNLSNINVGIDGARKLVMSGAGLEMDNSGVIRTTAGSVSVPSYSFTNDPDTGFFVDTLGILSVGTDSAKRAEFGPDGLKMDTGGVIRSTSGTNSVPAFSFVTDADTGMYNPTANHLYFVTGGTNHLQLIGSGEVRASKGAFEAIDGSASNPSYTFTNDQNTGIWSAPSSLNFTIDGNNKISLNGNGLQMDTGGVIQSSNGVLSLVGYGFTNDPDTGMYLPSFENLGFVTGGVERVRITTSALQLLNSTLLQFPDGSVGSPSISFVSNPDTGFYLSGSELSASVDGQKKLSIQSDGLEIAATTEPSTQIEVGFGRTTNGFAFIDLIGDATYTDFGTRLIRQNTGPNADTNLIHRGNGNIYIEAADYNRALVITPTEIASEAPGFRNTNTAGESVIAVETGPSFTRSYMYNNSSRFGLFDVTTGISPIYLDRVTSETVVTAPNRLLLIGGGGIRSTNGHIVGNDTSSHIFLNPAGAIEVINQGSTPFIDLKDDAAKDFDTRISLNPITASDYGISFTGRNNSRFGFGSAEQGTYFEIRSDVIISNKQVIIPVSGNSAPINQSLQYGTSSRMAIGDYNAFLHYHGISGHRFYTGASPTDATQNQQRLEVIDLGVRIGNTGNTPIRQSNNIQQMHAAHIRTAAFAGGGDALGGVVSSNLPSGWSVAYIGAANYEITHNLGVPLERLCITVGYTQNEGVGNRSDADVITIFRSPPPNDTNRFQFHTADASTDNIQIPEGVMLNIIVMP